ncbi:MAG TPA: NAD-dependent epimerase/dehydratase family protein [Thermoplasmata archaeon]
MNVFVAGATGVLGRRLVHRLAERGHHAVGLVRDDAGAKVVRSLGGEPRRASLFDPDGLARAAEGAEVVIRAATKIPTKLRTSPKDWAENDRIRIEGTKALTEAASRVHARAYVQESVVWAVRNPDGSPFDEDAPAVSDPVLASALEAERIARGAGARHGFAAATLRCGGFYGADAWHTRVMAEALSRGRPAMIRGTSPVWSVVHADDVAAAFVAASESPRSGVWHVVDDRPVALAHFLGSIATRLGAPPPTQMPAWIARLALGRYTAELLRSSFATSNARFRQDFGWRPAFPTCEQGLDEVVATMRAEGFPVRRA